MLSASARIGVVAARVGSAAIAAGEGAAKAALDEESNKSPTQGAIEGVIGSKVGDVVGSLGKFSTEAAAALPELKRAVNVSGKLKVTKKAASSMNQARNVYENAGNGAIEDVVGKAGGISTSTVVTVRDNEQKRKREEIPIFPTEKGNK